MQISSLYCTQICSNMWCTITEFLAQRLCVQLNIYIESLIYGTLYAYINYNQHQKNVVPLGYCKLN